MDHPTARTDTVTAFVGRTLRGPVNTPVSLRSFADYQHVFGGLWQPSPLSYAIDQYFEHGGQHALVVRVANGARPPTITLDCSGEILVLEALTAGSREFLRASVDYDNIAAGENDCFNLVVQRVRAAGSEYIEEQETFRRVSVSSATHRFVAVALLESKLVRVRGDVPARRPDPTVSAQSRYAAGYRNSNPDGDDGVALTDYDVIGSVAESSGLFALAHVPKLDFLYIPPLTRNVDVGVSTLLVAARFCRERHAMLIADPPSAWTSSNAALKGVQELNFFSDQAVMFYPRLRAYDRLRGRNEVFGNGGAVAGMLSRADDVRPVWATHRAEPELLLRPGVRPAAELREADRWRLANNGINTLQYSRNANPVRLLTRTLAGGINASADWGYVSTRRFALFVLGSIERGTRWVVLSQSSRSVWQRVHRQVSGFLNALVAAGAFPGVAAGREFFVICDERVNAPQSTGNEFNLLVGFAATRPDEYHSFMIKHSIAGSSVRPAAVNRFETAKCYVETAPVSSVGMG